MEQRRETTTVMVGDVAIGSGHPVVVQGMTKVPTTDVAAVTDQIEQMVSAGCELVRVAVPDQEAAAALQRITVASPVPIIADIHFDYRLGLAAIDAGVSKLRINPGNIGRQDELAAVAARASDFGVAIRIGANAGSLPRDIADKFGEATGEALAEAALRHVVVMEDAGCDQIVIACKSFEPWTVLEAYRYLASRTTWPFHIGITEAGPVRAGCIRSAVGIGLLLAEGLGDTVRVSLTASPIEEIRAAYDILSALGIRRRGPELVSCPTCARCEVDLRRVVEAVERQIETITVPIRIAVMGCPVNGPGEAKAADVGLAAGRGKAVLFVAGRVVRAVAPEIMIEELMKEIESLVAKSVRSI